MIQIVAARGIKNTQATKPERKLLKNLTNKIYYKIQEPVPPRPIKIPPTLHNLLRNCKVRSCPVDYADSHFGLCLIPQTKSCSNYDKEIMQRPKLWEHLHEFDFYFCSLLLVY